MRFLIDAQLPPALARALVSRGHEAAHVIDINLESSEDQPIWKEAWRRGAVIISKDEDFATLVILPKRGPVLYGYGSETVRIAHCSNGSFHSWTM